jgi:iron complex transport system substrate-binding protein
VAVGAISLAGCTAAAAPTPTPVATAAPAPTATATPTPAPAEFPATLVDDEGTSVTIPAQPQRIVSLSPANTETVFALGAGARLVGGTDADDFPAEAKALPDVATYQGVVVEQLVSLEPDLVLAAGNGFNPPADIARIRGLGIPVVVLYAEDVPGVLHDIELIGDAIGESQAAETMAAAMAARIEAVASAASALGSRPRTFYELGDQPEIYGPADGSFVADMVDLAGGVPITTGSTTAYSISLERLVTADPEVIVLGDANYGATPEAVAARPGWGGMTAVKTGAVRPVDDVVVTRPGPRLADGLAALALAIHPDLVLP